MVFVSDSDAMLIQYILLDFLVEEKSKRGFKNFTVIVLVRNQQCHGLHAYLEFKHH